MSEKGAPRRILITGCSSGIGRALASELTCRGHHVIATARRLETLDDLDVAGRLRLDVIDPASVSEAIAAAGRVDVLINNAGYSVWGAVEAVPVSEMQALFETNLFGALRMAQAVLPQMRARRSGIILQISSAAARRGNPLLGHYSASKAALEMYSEALRLEIARFGIDVSVVVLGSVATSFSDNRRRISTPAYDDLTQRAERQIAARRVQPTQVETVAQRIADALAARGRLPFRIAATDDAEALVSARMSLDDQSWQDQVLSRLYPDA